MNAERPTKPAGPLDRQLGDRLVGFVGAFLVERAPGPDPVNVPMMRHWGEALDMSCAIHLDDEAARASGRSGAVAPAAMTQAWVMRGYAATVRPSSERGNYDDLVDLLAAHGFSSVVATDSDFEFHRELVAGDLVGYTEVVESISAEKQTGLGAGHFVTTLKTYRDQNGQTVATQRWRTLRFHPTDESPGDPPTGTPDASTKEY